ncbi:MAG: hypothetical protein H7Z42_03075 [Roseiflexaceae bacterium]|nr:hypothetical protein [Roseiflexaceae bacterium]
MQKWIITGVAVTFVLLVIFAVCAYIFPDFRVATRDIAIILLAFTGLIAVVLTVTILFAVLYTVNKIRSVTNNTVIPQVQALQGKVDKILENVSSVSDSARTSVATVTTTTGYASEKVVAPIIKLSGLAAGVRAGASFLARRGAPRRER